MVANASDSCGDTAPANLDAPSGQVERLGKRGRQLTQTLWQILHSSPRPRPRSPRRLAAPLVGGAVARGVRALARDHALRVLAAVIVILGFVSGGELRMLAANGAPARSAPHPTGNPAVHAAAAGLRHAKFTLDNVTIAIASPFLPAAKFTAAKPGFPSQVASAIQWKPFEDLSITAIPYGTRSGTELPIVVTRGRASVYRAALHSFRAHQHAQSEIGPAALIFGKRVVADVSLVTIKLDSVHASPTLIVEWVTEAGGRTWIIQVTRAEARATTSLAHGTTFVASLSTLAITSNTLARPTTLAIALPHPRAAAAVRRVPTKFRTPVLALSATGTLGYPYWWNGSTCDTSLISNSAPLGTYYRGMPACGPVGTAVATSNFPGVQQLEWQCVELSMRYLYLAFNVSGYGANGNTVVANYNGAYPFQKLSNNGTYGQVPQPGDVLSYNTNSPNGHTSVVIATNVDGNGNGTIQDIEENGMRSGSDTLTVSNWQILTTSWGGWVSGWLHDPGSSGGGTLSPPTLQSPSNGATLNNRTVTFSWSPPNMANINGYTLHVSTTSTIDGGGSNLILDTGVGPTSYTYTFSQDYSTLWWGVATWNTSNQRSGFSGAWTFAINTTPADTTPPSESFTSPTTDTLTAPCYTGGGYPGSVNLAVYASDNVAMGYVTFFRYDGASGSWVALNTLNGSGPTYQMTLDCGTLPLGWNEIDAMAVDTSNNFTNQWIGLDHETPPAPPSNLVGQAPSCGQVGLSWTDNSSNEDGFNIYRDGSYLDQVGSNVTNYQDYSVAANTSYDYTVTAYSGAIESTPTSPATVNVPACPPDTTPPTEAFTSPTTNGQSASCYAGGSNPGSDLLQVSASDNVAMSYVTFFRWDNASFNWVALNTLTSPPYQFTLDCPTLQVGANDIDAMAVDTSNNFTNQSINLDYEVDPVNDAVAGATVLYSPWFGTHENTTAASTSGSDPSSTCGAGVNSNSVWFKYTPTVVKPLYVSTAGSGYDTVLAVWMVSGSTLVHVTCDDDAYGALTSWVTFLPRPGYTYYIEVMSFSTSNGGALQLTTSPIRMPTD